MHSRSFYSQSISVLPYKMLSLSLTSKPGAFIFNILLVKFYASYFYGLMTSPPLLTHFQERGCLLNSGVQSVFPKYNLWPETGWSEVLAHMSCLDTVSSALSGGWFGTRGSLYLHLRLDPFSQLWTEHWLDGLNFVIGINKTSLWSLYSFSLRACSPGDNISPSSSNALGKDLWWLL